MDVSQFTHLLKNILFLFRERGREGEREGERNQCVVASCAPPLGTWPATQECALTGSRTGDPLVCRLALNPLEPHQPGPAILVLAYRTYTNRAQKCFYLEGSMNKVVVGLRPAAIDVCIQPSH